MPEERVTARMRRTVEQRAKGRCEYCQSPSRFSTQSFSIEHIIPRDAGGSTTLENLALACQGCNNHKHTKTDALDPVTQRIVPLFHPRRQRWRDHFGWGIDYMSVIGFTPIGRATVEALHLNRKGLINLREILFASGKHPPPAEE